MHTNAKIKQRQNQEIGGELDLNEYENDEDFVDYENYNESTAIQLLKQHNSTNKGKKKGFTRWRPSYSNDIRENLHSILLPSYSTNAEINDMLPDETYVIEVIVLIFFSIKFFIFTLFFFRFLQVLNQVMANYAENQLLLKLHLIVHQNLLKNQQFYHSQI